MTARETIAGNLLFRTHTSEIIREASLQYECQTDAIERDGEESLGELAAELEGWIKSECDDRDLGANAGVHALLGVAQRVVEHQEENDD